VPLKEAPVTATIGIGANASGGFALSAALQVTLKGLPGDQAERLVQTAHQVCPYSNAVRNNIEVRIDVIAD